MSNDISPSVKLMIESGLIPENALQQLVNWRLLPEDSVELHGNKPVNLEKEWTDVEAFIHELKGALDQEAQTIRETELDQVGEYREATLTFRSCAQIPDSDVSILRTGNFTQTLQVFVDKLGRVILPARNEYEHLESITFTDGSNGSEIRTEPRPVTNTEARYRGPKIVAYVIYLEDPE